MKTQDGAISARAWFLTTAGGLCKAREDIRLKLRGRKLSFPYLIASFSGLNKKRCLMFGGAVFGDCWQAYEKQKQHYQRYEDKRVVHNSSSRRNQSPILKHNAVMINPASIDMGLILPADEGKKYPNTIAAKTSLPTSIQISDNFFRCALLNLSIKKYNTTVNLGCQAGFYSISPPPVGGVRGGGH